MGGRGASSGRKHSPTIKISMQFFAKKRSAIKLPKKEYGKIAHEINTLYHGKYDKGGTFNHYSGQYKYIIKAMDLMISVL